MMSILSVSLLTFAVLGPFFKGVLQGNFGYRGARSIKVYCLLLSYIGMPVHNENSFLFYIERRF